MLWGSILPEAGEGEITMNMDKKVIERLETIVEGISECYTSIPKEQVNELFRSIKWIFLF